MTETDRRTVQRVRDLRPRLREAKIRTRSLPSRNARGQFVAFPMTAAPNWYVFCAAGYRIPSDIEVAATSVDARRAPQPLPPARVVRRRRPAMRWEEVATWLLIAIYFVVVGWRALHLQPPHR